MSVAKLSALALLLLLAGPAMAQDSMPSIGGSIDSGSVDSSSPTAGSSSINSINVDDAARTGNFGAATSMGGVSGTLGDEFNPTLPPSDQAQLVDIPSPHIGVQLDQIRAALRARSSATPKADGS